MAIISAQLVAVPEPRAPGIDFETTNEVGYYQLVWRRFSSRKMALVALVALGVLLIGCFIVPFYLQAPSTDNNNTFANISLAHPFGTDEVGRDLLVRNLRGGQISLEVGFFAMLATIGVATILGAVAGFLGGLVDSVLTAITNAILSIPSVLILIAIAKVFTPTVPVIVLAIAMLFWPSTMRIVRAQVLSLREKEFVEAARALGASRGRIIVRHILPNALGPIIVSASLTIVAAILTESAISFLGVGIGEPTPTWGSLLAHGRDAIVSHNDFFYAFWPGMFILITVMCFNYLGDALRDAFDPRALER